MKKNLSTAVIIAFVIAVMSFYGCQKEPLAQQAKMNNSAATAMGTTTNGIATAIPAYYDSTKFKILFVEFSPSAEANLIAHNGSLNFIYQSDNGLPNNQPFISVIDAIPGGGPGMNPVWREVQIVFNAGFTPRQLFSDNAVLAAAAPPNPEITLNTTNEVYWCPVIGKK
jgi:hypothetical protein